MAAEEEVLARASREFVDNVTTMLDGLHVPTDNRERYIDFLYSKPERPDDDIASTARALGRLYLLSLRKSAYSEPYTGGEQVMIGLIMGRTVRENPLSIEAAANEFGMNYSDAALIKQDSVRLIFSGMQKLRQRADKSKDLYMNARQEVETISAKLGLSTSSVKKPKKVPAKKPKGTTKRPVKKPAKKK